MSDTDDEDPGPPEPPPPRLRAVKNAPTNTDPELEQGVAGAVVTFYPAAVQACLDAGLHGSHFATSGPRRVYETVVARHVAGQPADAQLAWRDLEDEVQAATLTLDRHDVLHAWPAVCPPPQTVAGYAAELVHLHRRRTTARLLSLAADAARDGDDAGAQRHLAAVENLGTAAIPALRHQTLGDFLANIEDAYDWAVPDLLERSDRVLVTAEEGGGKSTLLRQIAVQCAAGIHPFTLNPIPPLRVLLVDLENSERHLRRKLRPLRLSAGHTLDPDLLTVASIPEGLDLLDPGDVAAFTALVNGCRPDLVVGGPVYKLVGGDPTEEGPAKAAAMLLDRLRVAHNFALILETHQPHEVAGKRAERPYGASLWKRWPEFGLHIGKTERNVSELRHWRGARDERSWPSSLRRGGEWPWTLDAHSVTFAKILDATREAGEALSLRKLSIAIAGNEAMKDTIARAIDNNRREYDTFVAGLSDAAYEPRSPEAAPVLSEPDGPSWDDQAGLAGM